MHSGSQQPLLTLVTFSIAFGAILLSIIVGWLSPGPKGIIRVKRSEMWSGVTLEQAWQRLIDRLAGQRFQITSHIEHQAILAERPRGTTPGNSLSTHTHARSQLKGAFRLESSSFGVTVDAEVWNVSYIFYDTGESAHMGQVLQQVLHTDASPPELPPIANRSFKAVVGLSAAVLLWAWVLTIASGILQQSQALQVMQGMFAGGFVALMFGLIGAVEIRFHPREMRGTWIAVTAILLTVAAFVALPTAFYQGCGPNDKAPGGAWTYFSKAMAPSRK